MPVGRGTRRSVALVLAITALTLLGCAGQGGGSDAETIRSDYATIDREPSDYHGTLLREPTLPRPGLALRDTSGRRFDLDGRPDDEVTIVFFGYTHCPDVCPTTIADLAAARRQLPEAVRDRVAVVFITEDPKRDSPEVVREWLDRIDPQLVGLVGGNQDTEKALRALYLPPTAVVAEPDTPVSHPADGRKHQGDYALEHSGTVYAFGPGGTVVYNGAVAPRQYAEDFARLAGER